MSTTVPAWTKWRGLCEAMTPWAATPIGVWRGAWLPLAHPPPYLVLPHCISAPLVQRVEGSVPPAQTRTQKTDGVTLHWLNTGGQHFIYMPFHYSLSLSIDTLLHTRRVAMAERSPHYSISVYAVAVLLFLPGTLSSKCCSILTSLWCIPTQHTIYLTLIHPF